MKAFVTRSRRKDPRTALRIGLLTYRGNPTCGGQGVYVKYLSRALRELGHEVEVFSGPPYPQLDPGIPLHRIRSLDLYNPEHLFRPLRYRDLLYPINQFEFLSMCLGGFPEPCTFGWRVARYLRRNGNGFDIVHDNQCLAYGLLSLVDAGYPTVATIHHPITVDRRVEIGEAATWRKRLKVRRWYAFLRMQKRVSRRLARIITVSESSRKDIGEDYGVPAHRFRVVPNGINLDFFYPLPEVPREDNRLLVTTSADTPLKGLPFLLTALADIRKNRDVRLTIVGAVKPDGLVAGLIREMGLSGGVEYAGRIDAKEFARYYARTTIAVIPSLYEGFGMPAGEAMACGVPVISTDGGALPEVIGDAGVLVPPADAEALKRAIVGLLDDRDRRRRLAEAGLARVRSAFTWRHAAEKTVDVYREILHDHD